MGQTAECLNLNERKHLFNTTILFEARRHVICDSLLKKSLRYWSGTVQRKWSKDYINLVLREVNEVEARMEQTLGHVHWPTFILAVSNLPLFFSLKNSICIIFATYTGRKFYHSALRNWEWSGTQIKIICTDFILIYLTGLEKLSVGISYALAPNFSLGFCFKYYSSY